MVLFISWSRTTTLSHFSKSLFTDSSSARLYRSFSRTISASIRWLSSRMKRSWNDLPGSKASPILLQSGRTILIITPEPTDFREVTIFKTACRIALSPLLIPDIINGFFAFFNICAIFPASSWWSFFPVFESVVILLSPDTISKPRFAISSDEEWKVTSATSSRESLNRVAMKTGLFESCASSRTGASFHNWIPFFFASWFGTFRAACRKANAIIGAVFVRSSPRTKIASAFSICFKEAISAPRCCKNPEIVLVSEYSLSEIPW